MDTIELCVQDTSGQQDHPRGSFGHLQKHGPAEKVRKAIVQLLGLEMYNPSVAKTKQWQQLRLQHRPNSSNIQIGVIETPNVARIYAQENQRTH